VNPAVLLILLNIVFFGSVRAQDRSDELRPILVSELAEGDRTLAPVGESKSERLRRAEASSATSLERQAFDLLNAERFAIGLEPLMWDDRLSKVARLHSRNMANEKFFSHRGNDGTMIDDRAELLGVRNWAAIGENIAFLRGYADPVAGAVEKWMQSPSHRRNLLNPTWANSAIGIAVADDGAYYLTQVFLRMK
jgi:uncharacterized protein YkwD